MQRSTSSSKPQGPDWSNHDPLVTGLNSCGRRNIYLTFIARQSAFRWKLLCTVDLPALCLRQGVEISQFHALAKIRNNFHSSHGEAFQFQPICKNNTCTHTVVKYAIWFLPLQVSYLFGTRAFSIILVSDKLSHAYQEYCVPQPNSCFFHHTRKQRVIKLPHLKCHYIWNVIRFFLYDISQIEKNTRIQKLYARN